MAACGRRRVFCCCLQDVTVVLRFEVSDVRMSLVNGCRFQLRRTNVGFLIWYAIMGGKVQQQRNEIAGENILGLFGKASDVWSV